MKEFIEELIDRLEIKEQTLLDNAGDIGCTIGIVNAMERSKEIVNELAEEYKGNLSESLTGWIPCSERLPEGNKAVLVCTNEKQIDVDYYGEYIKDFIGLKGTEQYAIAWQPLPQPYKEEGAKCTKITTRVMNI